MLKNKYPIIISHRGNINGPSIFENVPSHIQKCLDDGIECEIDVWKIQDTFYLGHDNTEHKIDFSFLTQKGLWCHAKNLEALSDMLKQNINCFWHQDDDFTLTSSGYIWTYPNKNVLDKSIIVDNDPHWKEKNYQCYGVCSDYIF
jgi:hypothetical protein